MDPSFSGNLSEPLGFAAFALFLVFLFLTKYAKSKQQANLLPLFIGAALLSLLAGIALFFMAHNQGNTMIFKAVKNGNIIESNEGDVNVTTINERQRPDQ